jgi:predicted SAM-dependent methyltransferase
MISPMERFQVMAMMFGGQINEYDVHKVGFDIDFLTAYLEAAGFKEYRQVSELGLFNDTSSMRVMNTLISLNILATK